MSALELLDHYRLQACSSQWRGFVLAMAEEFMEALPEADLARLMTRIGERFARAHPLPQAVSLEDLERSANVLWSTLAWGQVRFQDQGDGVRIEHLAAPLTALLASQAGWAPAFLQGVYRQWFSQAGMLPALDVQPAAGGSADVSCYVLARVS